MAAAAAAATGGGRAAPAQAEVFVSPPLEMPGLARRRRVRVCLPPGYGERDEHYPVVYLHDGQNLFDAASAPHGGWGVPEALATLSATAGLGLIAVGIDHGGERRLQELSPWPNPRLGEPEGRAYTAFVAEVVKPYVDARWRTRPGRANTAMVGSSLAAMVTHHALDAWRNVFGAAAVLSPAYWVSEQVYERARDAPPPADTRIFLYAGGRESEAMLPDLVRMHALLASTRPAGALSLSVAPLARHDESAWRAVLPQALAWLFRPGQDPGAKT